MIIYNGDIKKSCNYWSTLLSQLTFSTRKNDSNLNDFHSLHAYETIEQRLQDNLHPVHVLQEISSSITCTRNPAFVQYHWEINLDKGSLVLYRPFYSVDFKLEWSFKCLYFMLSKHVVVLSNLFEVWTEEANSLTVQGDVLRYRLPFQAIYALVLIQRQVRRFLAMQRANRDIFQDGNEAIFSET